MLSHQSVSDQDDLALDFALQDWLEGLDSVLACVLALMMLALRGKAGQAGSIYETAMSS
jgi:hypothetical protein